MLKLPQGAKVVEISEKNVSTQYKTYPKSIRPEVFDAKVYKEMREAKESYFEERGKRLDILSKKGY